MMAVLIAAASACSNPYQDWVERTGYVDPSAPQQQGMSPEMYFLLMQQAAGAFPYRDTSSPAYRCTTSGIDTVCQADPRWR